MLLDQVFGVHNFLSNVVWQGGRKNDSRYVSNGADYMLIYAKDEPAMAEREIRWREEKSGMHDVLSQGAKVWAKVGLMRRLPRSLCESGLNGSRRSLRCELCLASSTSCPTARWRATTT